MRADPHYVDLLASRSSMGRERVLAVQSIDAPLLTDPSPALVESIKRDGVLQPLLVQQRDGAHRLIAGRKRLSAAIAAGLRDVPCVVFDVDDPEAARLADVSNITTKGMPHSASAAANDAFLHGGAELAQSLATLTACADLLSGSPSDLSRAVAGNLIRAEVWRASCLLLATRIVRRELPVARGAISVVALLGRLEQAFLPERQLRSVIFETSSSVPAGSFIAGDEKLLAGALASAVLSTLAWLDGMKEARLALTASLEPSGHVTFTVSQETVAAPEVWLRRAFDHQWTDRPGGLTAAVSMLAVRTVAEAHGGTATVGAGRGTRISILMPTGI
jgi:ParB-like nuclease family protein